MNNANKPVYLKLRDIISESILDGEYQEGDMLPSVRSFAADQGANPLTVAKAYQGFQEDGLVTVKRGVGMFVASGAKVQSCAMPSARILSRMSGHRLNGR